jgi:hypothetical protein
MALVGKTVRFTETFLRGTGQISGDTPFKMGVVESEMPVSEKISLVKVNDTKYGEWKALSSKVEVVG